MWYDKHWLVPSRLFCLLIKVAEHSFQFKVDRLQIILVAKNIYLRVATVHQ